MLVRPANPDEYGRLGDITYRAYAAIDPYIDVPYGDTNYGDELRDVATRAAVALVLAAIDGDGTVVGGVTYVGDPASPVAEFTDPDAAGIRMLAVDPDCQRTGAGAALTQACIARAKLDGKKWLVLHSTPFMTAAHRIYERLGFVRDESMDWEPIPDFLLLGFRLEL